ncbi:hypothetical protein DH2020_035259 [Rehmannia glutinosa]|uniref:SH3 domain-containing protein n=1 Tax=Rehmannia glutinosa TaxID=99300 RepID=A0ABR0V9K8_REHGL
MEAIRKQATKLREQVAKQQQAVLKHFVGGSDNIASDETELQQHQKLEKLYISTRAAKHFQRDIVRGVEGYITTGSKQVDIGQTLITEPLRAMVVGSPLEEARHLAQRYDRVRQEAESQDIDVARCQARVRETNVNSDNILKLEAAETKLHELKLNMATLGKEAAAAMAAVEGQQQRLTLQRLITMVEAERTYHQNVLQILNQLELEMLFERQHSEASPFPAAANMTPPSPPACSETEGLFASHTYDGSTDGMGYFLGSFIHTKLRLMVTDNGWAEGESKGKAGWFPFKFIERRERVLASKVAEVF